LATQEVPNDPAEAIRTTAVVFDALNDHADGNKMVFVSERDQITCFEWSELTFHGGLLSEVNEKEGEKGCRDHRSDEGEAEDESNVFCSS
jgi:hypothetical protein